MDAKISKKRLNHLLSYDWVKILIVALAAVLVWNLIFTMTETRRLPSQAVSVMNYTGAKFGASAETTLNDTLFDGRFSHEVLETECLDATRAGEQYTHTLLESYFTTDECDIVVVANVNDPESEQEVDGEKKYLTYAQEFIGGYAAYVVDAGAFFDGMRSYLNGYYTNGYADALSLDKQKIEDDFRARIKSNQDKRYKTEDVIKTVVDLEYERIEKYRQALLNVEEYLQKGYLRLDLVGVDVADSSGQTVRFERTVLNICPDEDLMGNIKKEYYYEQQTTDEATGGTLTVAAAKDMSFVFVETPNMDSNFYYETVLYIDTLVQKYCTALQPQAQ